MPSQVPQPNDGEEQPDTTLPSSGRGSPIDSEKMQMLRAMREQLISNRATINEKDTQLEEAKNLLEDARAQLKEANLTNASLLNENKQLETKVRVTKEMSVLGKQMAQLKDLEVKSLKLEIQGLMQKVNLLCEKVERDRRTNNDEDFDNQKHKALMDDLSVLKEESKKQKEIIEKMEKECLHPTTADSKLAEQMFILSNLFSELEKPDNELSFLELVGERMSSLLITGKEEQEPTDGTVPVPLHKCFKVGRIGENQIVAVNTRDTLLYIKDLLISQRKLEEEVKSLKEVNNQLKLTVMEQERELSSINIELTSAWGMINKVKNQHGILHNAREAHRHDLREKRKLLNKLKEELEFSHQKLLSLRVMNKDSQAEWQSMRDERDSRLLSGSDAPEAPIKEETAVSQEKQIEADVEEAELMENNAPEIVPTPEESRVASPTESEALPSNDEIIDTENVKILEKEERLKLLEDQCKFLYAKVLRSTHRSIVLAERLSALHDQYGSNDEAGTSKASTPAPETPKERTPPAGDH